MILLNGDCLDKLKELEADSVDSIVTDPPYGLAFMGKKWDYDVPSQAIWEECMRVLKPGGHLLSFAGSRTYHRMAVRIEDAGFEIRDQIMWIYGSGFPKSHNIALAIDKAEGATGHRGKAINIKGAGNRKDLQGKEAQNQNSEFYHKPYNEPISDNGKQWNGWGTALKPSHEPIVMARKPFKGTVADNVLEYGVGGLNIDGTRVSVEDMDDYAFNMAGNQRVKAKEEGELTGMYEGGWKVDKTPKELPQGRWPANVILDEEAGMILDKQSENIKGGKAMPPFQGKPTNDINFTSGVKEINRLGYNDNSGASRFFYCPKASKNDRDEGLTIQAKAIKGRDEGQDKTSIAYKARPTERQNIHPTVKPTDLMGYLIRLVTPKGGIVLDPFMGSGSTGKAAVREGMDFIGIEREEEYYEIAKQRIDFETNKRKFW
jgi:site-specific DNA-methyltransferase (adenine-specific)